MIKSNGVRKIDNSVEVDNISEIYVLPEDEIQGLT